MAINWGAALGAAVDTGIKTYERLGEEELREMQRQQLKKDIAEKEALDRAFRETQGRVGQQDEYGQAIKTGAGMSSAGTPQAQMLSNQGALPTDTPDAREFEKAAAESAAGAMRENAVRQGAIPESKAALPELKPTEYTADQGMKDYVAKSGLVSRKGMLEALQLKGVMRESDLQDKYDAATKKITSQMAEVQTAFVTGGMKDLAKVAKENGVKVEFVDKGPGSYIRLLGPNGDTLKTFSDGQSAVAAMEEAISKEYSNTLMTLFGSPDKAAAFIQGQKQIKLKEREVDIKGRELDIKEPYYKAAANAENAKAGALNSTAEERAAGKAYIEKYNALTPEQKNSPEGRALLEQAEGAMAARSGDVARIRANTPLGKAEAGYEVAAKEAAKLGEPLPSYDKYMAGRGFAPDAVIKGEQAKIDDLVKKGKLAEAVKKAEQFNSTFKNTKIPVPTGAVPVPGKAATQTSALPNEDTTKYIRSKNGRGAYVYTPSSRGQTKAQYAAIDANQS
jgi:hypothetical protein